MSDDNRRDLIWLGWTATSMTGKSWHWSYAGESGEIDMPSWQNLPDSGTTDTNDRYMLHLGRFIESRFGVDMDEVRKQRQDREQRAKRKRIAELRAELARLEAE